ncbi:MAG: nSTAND1 domain-containing NTPase, partial [Planctomycetota bacterium]
MPTLSPESFRKSVQNAERFVNWLVDVWQRGGWVRRLLLLGMFLLFFFNPTFISFFFGFLPPQLPGWYLWAFWFGTGLTFGSAWVVAIRTKPASETPAAKLGERRIVKGLLAYDFDDGELFATLQRQSQIHAWVETIASDTFRFGILSGESGCGKTSFLRAGLWPVLESRNHRCLYVSFSDLDPFDSLRQAFAQHVAVTPEEMAGADLPSMLHAASRIDSKGIVLFFDQFEQFFRKSRKVRKPFVSALAEWYQAQFPSEVRILICVRSDFADRMNEFQKAMGYSLGPHEIFRLEDFEPEQATEVFRAIAEVESLEYDERFVREFMEQEFARRDDGLVSPVDLQVVAWMITAQRIAERRAFTRSAFQKLGGVAGLLERFLERALQATGSENRRRSAIEVLLALADEDSSGNSIGAGVLTVDQLRKKLAGRLKGAEVKESVNWLARSDVRLISPSKRDGATGYQLAHETLIPALLKLAGRSLEPAMKANQLADRRVNEWLGNDRSSRYLLSLGEWWLIWRQRARLVWGPRRRQKEELLRLSRRRYQVRGAFLMVATLVVACGVAWWYSPSGQIYQCKHELRALCRRIDDAVSLRLAAKALALCGHLDEAVGLADKAALVDKMEPPEIRNEFHVELAAIAADVGTKDEALLLLRLVQQRELSVSALLELTRIAAKLEEKKKSRTLLQKAEKQLREATWPDDSGFTDLAATAAAIGDSDKAAALFEEAKRRLSLNKPDYPSRVADLEFLAETAKQIGRFDEAEDIWRRLEQLVRETNDSFALGGLAYQAA